MVVTSLAGHLMELDFPETYRCKMRFSDERRKWSAVDPIDLFSAEVHKYVKKDMNQVCRWHGSGR